MYEGRILGKVERIDWVFGVRIVGFEFALSVLDVSNYNEVFWRKIKLMKKIKFREELVIGFSGGWGEVGYYYFRVGYWDKKSLNYLLKIWLFLVIEDVDCIWEIVIYNVWFFRDLKFINWEIVWFIWIGIFIDIYWIINFFYF